MCGIDSILIHYPRGSPIAVTIVNVLIIIVARIVIRVVNVLVWCALVVNLAPSSDVPLGFRIADPILEIRICGADVYPFIGPLPPAIVDEQETGCLTAAGW